MLPLERIRVLDLSRVLAGPYCTMLLADLGADVVKVERPGAGDETRTWGPPYIGGESAYFLSVNRGKRSIAVDLRRPEGRQIVQRLAGRADVVLENFRPGTAERLGVGYDDLARDNPQLVYCSISCFGPGDHEARPGYDFVVQAESGLMAITGQRDGPPTKVGIAVVDVLTGYAAATSILAALTARATSGRGARLQVSLLDTALSALVNVAAAALITGNEPHRHGNAHPNIVPYQTFDTQDGAIAVAAANDGLFRRLCSTLERPELPDDERFHTNPLRVEHRDELIPELQRVFLTRPTADWQSRLDEAGVPAGKVRNVLDALAAFPAKLNVEHPTAGPLRLVSSPVQPADLAPLPPPLLGQHTREILAQLGCSHSEIEALERKAVIA